MHYLKFLVTCAACLIMSHGAAAQSLNTWEYIQPSGPDNALGGRVSDGIVTGAGRALIRTARNRHYVRDTDSAFWVPTTWFIGEAEIRRLESFVGHVSDPLIITAQAAFDSGVYAVVRSYDAGMSWSILNEIAPPGILRADSIAVASADSDIILVRVDGVGLLKSIDGGATWSNINPEVSAGLSKMKFDAGNSNLIYGLDDSRISRSTNGGLSFVRADNGISASQSEFVRDLVIDPGTPGRAYVSTGNDGLIWRTDDSGANWTLLLPGLADLFDAVVSLAVDPFQPDRMYAVVGTSNNTSAYVSQDGGITWGELANQVVLSRSASRVLVGPDGRNLLIGLRGVGIINGSNVEAANAGLNEFQFDRLRLVSGDAERMAGAGALQGIASTNPQRPLWELRNVESEYRAMEFMVDPVNPDHWHAVTDQGFTESFDAGRTWISISTPGERVSDMAVSPLDSDLIHLRDTLGILSTSDGGATWLRGVLDDEYVAGSTDFPFAASPTSRETAFFGTAGQGVFATHDAGLTWSRQLAPFGESYIWDIKFDPNVAGRVFVATRTSLWRSDDNGTSWQALIDDGTQFQDFIFGIALDPVVDGRVFYSGLSNEIYANDPRTNVWSAVVFRPSGIGGTVFPGEILQPDPVKSGLLYYVSSGLARVQLDSDGDGQGDHVDNCILTANPDQNDTDGDGIGNFCDPDIAPATNDCVVNVLDLAALRQAYFSEVGDSNWNSSADFNSDGTVNVIDFGIMRAAFFSRPGYSSSATLCSHSAL